MVHSRGPRSEIVQDLGDKLDRGVSIDLLKEILVLDERPYVFPLLVYLLRLFLGNSPIQQILVAV